jgi:hypothetical protein
LPFYICNHIALTNIKYQKMNLNLKTFLMASMTVAMMVSCKKDEPAPVEDNETITTVRLKFTQGGTTTTFNFKDLDGDGGNAPVIDKISLKPNTTYTLAVEVLDETKNPVSDITTEIKKEQDEHIIEYVSTPATVLSVTATDKDSRNFPVGLAASAKTTTAGTGKLRVILHHQPPVNNVAVKNGTFTVGSTDFDVAFDVEVK